MSAASVATDSLESLVGQVADEFLRRQRDGERPDVEEYVARYPQAADVLRPVLASLGLLGLSKSGQAAMSAETSSPEVAGTLGDFRILREIGRGGMGVVYEAEQISLGRRVALKVLPFASTLDPKQLQRFKNEAQAAAGLHHTNIVPVYATGCERGVHYYAMQFIEGRTLADVIAELRRASEPRRESEPRPLGRGDLPEATTAYTPLPDGRGSDATPPVVGLSTDRSILSPAFFRGVAQLGVQAAEALEHAHQLGIIHRDIKPANLLVENCPLPTAHCPLRLWITDFGLAHCQSQAGLTMTGDLVGTLRYMSPEQALAKRITVDHRTDIYSLGATLYELLTLHPAFNGRDREELLRQIAFEEPRQPRRLSKAVPADLETIVLKAMEKNPAERYASAQELADDLERFLKDEPIRARRPTLVQRARKWGRRHPTVVWSFAVCLLVIVMAVAGSFGWAARDRAARHNQLRNSVEVALQDAEQQRDGGHWYEARSFVWRAQSLLVAGTGDDDLRSRITEILADLNMVDRLAKIRLEAASTIKDGFVDSHSTDARYVQAFQDYGIDVESLPAEEAIARIRKRPIAAQLVTNLENWAVARSETSKLGPKQLLRIAREANPEDDPFRKQLSLALERKERQELLRLANEARHQTLLPRAALFLAGCLFLPTVGEGMLGARTPSKGAAELAVKLLRRTQQEYPDDFWINFELALRLQQMQPPQLEEAIGFYRVALALNRRSFGAYMNLGNALLEKRDLPGAIAAYKKGIACQPGEAPGYHNLGSALHEAGDLPGALAACRKAIEIKPKWALSHCLLSSILRDMGDLPGAFAACQEAIHLRPDMPQGHKELGNVRIRQGRLVEAEAAYREALRIRPEYAEPYCGLGIVRAEQGRLDDAEAAFRTALGHKPELAEAHTGLGDVLRRKGKFADAEAAHREAIRLRPDLQGAYTGLANVLRHQDKSSEAETHYRKAIDLNPKDPYAHTGLGNVLWDLGRLDEAEQEQREAIRLGPQLPGLQMNLGNILRARGNLRGALAAYQKAVAGFEKADGPAAYLALAYNNLGIALRGTGDPQGAVEACGKAIKLQPGLAMAHCNFGCALLDLGEKRAAIAAIEKAITLDPRMGEAHYWLGRALQDTGDIPGAVTAFQKAVALKPRMADAYSDLGTVLRHQGKYGEAEAAQRKAIEFKPDYALAYNRLGAALADQGRFAEAKDAYKEAIRLEADLFEAHHNLGVVLGKEGKFQDAAAAFKEAIRLKPDLAGAYYNLSYALQQLGQFSAAVEMLRRFHERDDGQPETAKRLADANRLAALDKKLPEILRGESQPANMAERLELARLCQMSCKRLHAAAVRFYAEAFAAQPELAEDLQIGRRYDAACSAAQAGCGLGEDASKLSDEKRTRLRQQALDWLRADLLLWIKQRQTSPHKDGASVHQTLRHWQRDPDLATVRDADSLAKLPEAERQAWQKLWTDVAETLSQASKPNKRPEN